MTTRNPSTGMLSTKTIVEGRVFVDCTTSIPHLDPGHGAGVSGIKLTGLNAAKQVRRIRALYPDLPVLFDAANCEHHDASTASPFNLPDDQLFAVTLESRLQEQSDLGTTMAITPTGHIGVEAGVIESIVEQANTLRRSNVIVDMPLHHKWMTTDRNFETLTSVIDESIHPVSISLAHHRDPSSMPGVVHRCRQLATLDTSVFMHRVDFLGLDFVAHGGAGASLGLSSKLRHGTSQSVQGRRFTGSDNRASIIWPGMLRFVRPVYLEKLYGSAPAAKCACPFCDGRPINSFDLKRRSQDRARSHNAWWIQQLTAQILQPADGDSLGAWRELVASALEAHQSLASELSQPNFAAPKPLDVWAW